VRVSAARAGEMCSVYRPASRSAVLAACTRAEISTCAGMSWESNRLPVIVSISSSVSTDIFVGQHGNIVTTASEAGLAPGEPPCSPVALVTGGIVGGPPARGTIIDGTHPVRA
jgi:hypothetical protein